MTPYKKITITIKDEDNDEWITEKKIIIDSNHRKNNSILQFNNIEELAESRDSETHCIDGPAIFKSDGFECWMIDGRTHRSDGGPAITKGLTRTWMKGGQKHREDGPAIESDYEEINDEWYFMGSRYSFDDFLEYIDPELKVKLILKYGKEGKDRNGG